MTAAPPPTDLAAWLTDLEAAHEEFRRGGPGAAAVTLFTFPEAIPRLVAAVRAVEALAEELDGEACDRWRRVLAAREADDRDAAYGERGAGDALHDAASRIRAALGTGDRDGADRG